MAKIGGMELLVILVVALFVIGPERLPKAARTLGRAVASFKKSMNDATSELREVSDEFKGVTDEIASAQKTMKNALLDADEEIKAVGREADETLNGKKKKKKAQADEPAKDEPAAAQAPDKEAAAEPEKTEAAQPEVTEAAQPGKTADNDEQQDAAAAV